MKRKTITHYVDVEVNTDVDILIKDIIDNLDFEDAKLIAEDFGLIENKVNSSFNLYRFLCDICEVNYHTKKDNLLQILKDKL